MLLCDCYYYPSPELCHFPKLKTLYPWNNNFHSSLSPDPTNHHSVFVSLNIWYHMFFSLYYFVIIVFKGKNEWYIFNTSSFFFFLLFYIYFIYLFSLSFWLSGLSCGMRDLCCSMQDLSLRCGLFFVVCGLLSGCGAWFLERVGSVVCGMWALSLRHMRSVVVACGLSCPVARGILVPRQGIERTHVPCIGRWILNHWTTREVPNTLSY